MRFLDNYMCNDMEQYIFGTYFINNFVSNNILLV